MASFRHPDSAKKLPRFVSTSCSNLNTMDDRPAPAPRDHVGGERGASAVVTVKG